MEQASNILTESHHACHKHLHLHADSSIPTRGCVNRSRPLRPAASRSRSEIIAIKSEFNNLRSQTWPISLALKVSSTWCIVTERRPRLVTMESLSPYGLSSHAALRPLAVSIRRARRSVLKGSSRGFDPIGRRVSRRLVCAVAVTCKAHPPRLPADQRHKRNTSTAIGMYVLHYFLQLTSTSKDSNFRHPPFWTAPMFLSLECSQRNYDQPTFKKSM